MIKIDNSKISEKAWGDVDKTKLGNALAEAYETGDANKVVIKEAYAYVPDDAFDDDKFLHSKAKLPHHELIGNTLVLNRGGVVASYGALVGARAKVDIPENALASVKAHIRRHYKDIGLEIPDKLK